MTVKFTNNASSTLASGINTTATSLTVADASTFPSLSGADDYCYLTIQQATGTAREVVKATARSGNNFTIQRAFDNTTARAFSASDIVELRMTAALLQDVIDQATVEGIKTNYQFVPTAGQTQFSGADNSGDTLVINDAELVNVYMNGVRLVQGSDYTVSSSNNRVTLTTGATTADIIDIEVFGNFTGQSGAAVGITGGAISGTAITTGSINNTPIGATQANTVAATTLTANSVAVDNITIDGNEIDVGSGNFVLDVAGEIELDADGGKWIFLDGGTQIGRIENSSSDLVIKASVNDKDIKFNGEDGGSNITALTLDMSNAGAATFNSTISSGAITSSGLTVSSDSGGPIYLQDSNATATYNISELSNNGGNFGIQTRDSSGTFVSTDYQIIKNASGADYHRWFTQGSERMRIQSGNVLVGTTTSAPQNFSSGSGTQISDGYIAAARGGAVALLNRISTDGDIVEFKKDGSTVGSIGVTSGNDLVIDGTHSSTDTGLKFVNGTLRPRQNSTDSDGDVNLGAGSFRFKDLYLAGTANASALTTTNSGITLQSASVTKSAINVAATTNQGINGTAAGDQYNWTTGGKMLWSTNSGTNAHMILDGSGNLDVNGTVTVGTTFTTDITGNNVSFFRNNGASYIQQRGGHALAFQTNDGSDRTRLNIGATGDISFYEDTGTTPKLFWDASAESLGIGSSSPDTLVHLSATADAALRFEATDTTINSGQYYGRLEFEGNDAGTSAGGIRARIDALSTGQNGESALVFNTSGVGSDSDNQAMRIDSSGQVRLSNTTPVWDTTFSSLVTKGGFTGSQSASYLYSGQNIYYNGGFKYSASSLATLYEQSFGRHIFYNASSGTAGNAVSLTQAMTLDASANLLVGKQVENTTTVGIQARADGLFAAVKASAESAIFGRNTDDGNIVLFRKDGSTVGSIGTVAGAPYYAGVSKALRIGTAGFYPATNAGAYSDGTVDLGYASGRFKDIHLSGAIGNGAAGLQFNDGSSDDLIPYSMTAGDTVDNSISLGIASKRFKDLYLSGIAYASQIQATNSNGSNGTTTAQYAVIGLSSGTAQATIGSHHLGDGYANLNLGSTVSGDRKMWHISKRISGSSTQNRLEFFWYESGGFNSRFQFETDGAFQAVDRITSNKGIHGTSVNNVDDGLVVKAGSGDSASSRGRFSNNAADVAIGRNIATFPGTWTKADNSVASGGWVFGTSGAAAFYQSNAGDTTPLANQRFRIMDGSNNGTVIIGSSTTTHSYDAPKVSLTGAGNIVAAYSLASTNEFWILNNLANIASGVVCKVDFRVLNLSKGYIGITSTGVQYNQGSDYRLKDELNYDFDATSLVKKIKPVQFKWLADMDAGIDTGFIAHELQEVHPFAVSGEKDAVREDGEIAPQGVDASKLVGLLTKALQEALSRIDSLEGKVKALEEAA